MELVGIALFCFALLCFALARPLNAAAKKAPVEIQFSNPQAPHSRIIHFYLEESVPHTKAVQNRTSLESCTNYIPRYVGLLRMGSACCNECRVLLRYFSKA